jgi:hypothetical protein
MRHRYYKYWIFNKPNGYDEVASYRSILKDITEKGYECLPGVYFFIHDSSKNLVHLVITEQSPWYNSLIWLPNQSIGGSSVGEPKMKYTTEVLRTVIKRAVRHNAKKVFDFL